MSRNTKLLEAALDYEAGGWKIVPLHGKEPLVKWGSLRSKPTSEKEIRNWFDTFGNKLTGVGLITGLDEDVYVLDLEHNEDPDRFDLPDTVCSRSGGGGWHYYFKTPDSFDKEKLPTTDLRKHGITGELRADGSYTTLPPSIHPDGGKYKWVVPLDVERLAPIPQWLLELTDKDVWEPTDWKDVMKGATEGSRHTTTVTVAGKFLHSFPQSEWNKIVLPSLLAWNDAHNHPPLQRREVYEIFKSLASKNKKGESDVPKPKRELHTISSILSMPENERPQFLIHQLVPEKGITALSGHPGHGKSWLMLSMIQSIATGTAFLDSYTTKQANVLVIDEESGIWEMRRRMELLQYPEDMPVYFYSQCGFKVDRDSDLKELLKTVDENGIGLIVLDPFVAFHSGVENNAEEAQAVMEKLQLFNEKGVAVLFIHHHRKNGIGSSGQSLRGSSAFSGRLDSHITVSRADETHTTQTLDVEQVKSRRGKNLEPFQVVLSQEDTASPVVMESRHDMSGKKFKKDKARNVILELLKLGEMPKTEIIEEVKKEEPIGERNIHQALADLVTDKEINVERKGRKHHYSLNQETEQ